ncbi:hypothetical protein Celaphus_00007382 [Cervus elaphus hippelaphus]|uniref:Uncharacterized protein n=1 Tax=Cervus elaphus hippelaphus TaxID=46360 RepID=A0A212CZ54_CEREH|nr:hypothetical protein Celaphus_00007382 [Cervus elaphus hippelaphus]
MGVLPSRCAGRVSSAFRLPLQASYSKNRKPDTDEHTLHAEQQFCSSEAVTLRLPASLAKDVANRCGGLLTDCAPLGPSGPPVLFEV